MNAQATLKEAQQAQKIGNYTEAERLYLELLNIGFQAEAMLSYLVNVCILANSIDRAAEYLTQLTFQFPSKITYCDALASIYARASNWSAAAECYARFVAHNPHHADAHYNRAYNLKQAAKYDEAIVSYKTALDNNVNQPEEVLTNMAVIYSEQLRAESQAMDCLKRALIASPRYIPAMFNLATLYEEDGSKDKAAQYYQSILLIDPKEYTALVRLAEAQKVSDSNAPIVQQLKAALNDFEADKSLKASLNFALGKVLNDCGQYDSAFKYYTDGNNLDAAGGLKYCELDQETLVQDNIRLFTEQWFADLAPVSDEAPIFICGMFRSGSTLIEQVLASHSSLTAGGERDFFVRLATEGSLQAYPNGVDRLEVPSLKVLADRYLDELYKAFPQATLVTDKRPDNFLYLGLIKTLFPKAKIIHSTRQSLDNCLSIYFLRADTSINYATNLDSIAHYYKQYERLMRHWESLFTNSIYQVDYDNLVENPEPEIRGLLGFLELPWEGECLEFHRLKNRVKTASIWQVRQPFYQSSSGRWKNYERNISNLKEALRH